MKRIFLFAAALFAAVSCAEVGIEELATVTDSDAATNVSVLVSAIDSADSRISVDDAWAATWDEGDALTAWSSGDGALTMFEMTSYDAEASTFSGAVTGNYRLIYPYDAAATVSGSSYTVDLSSQEAGVNSTYMVSTGVALSASNATATMSHVGAAAELVTMFKNVSGAYTLTSVAISGLPTSVAIDLGAEVTADGFYGESTVGTIVVDVEDVAVSASEMLSVRFNILSCEIAVGESIAVVYNLEDESGAVYSVSSEIVNSGSDVVSFERATYNTINSTCDMDTAVATAAVVTLADLSADNIPELDTWVITDTTAESGSDFAGFNAAIVALTDSGREISIIFPNLQSVPSYAISGQESHNSSMNDKCIVSISAPVATNIGISGFRNCDALVSIDFPMVITAQDYAFYSCGILADINMPLLETVGKYSFAYIKGISTLDLPSLVTSANYSFAGSSIVTANLPNLVTVGSSSFRSCEALVSFDAPNVETVYNSAFYDCESLVSISLPKATLIDYSAFRSCAKLTTVDLPSAVTLGYAAFQYSYNLNNFTIGANVESIGGTIFTACYGLTNLIIESPNFSQEDGVLYNADKTTVISMIGSLSPSDIVLPDSVTEVISYAFSYSSYITSLTGENVKTLGSYAFAYTNSAVSAVLPSLTSIGSNAFAVTSASSCKFTSLSLATNPNTELESLGSSIFSFAAQATAIDLTLGTANKDNVSGSTLTVGSTSWTFKSITIESTELESSVAEITLSEISADNIPELDTWVITDTTATADDFAGLKAALVALDDSGRQISLEFPNLTDFPASALASTADTLDLTALVSVKADSAVTLNSYAFQYCDGLESFSAAAATTAAISPLGFCTALVDLDLPLLATAGNYFVRYCSSLKELYVPSLVTIGNYATNYCTSLESISMPKLTTTGSTSFGYCESLVDVNLPSMVTYGNHTFMNCASLETVELASTVTTLGYNFVSCCNNLKTINTDNNSIYHFEDNMLFDTAKTTVYVGLPYYMQGAIEVPSTVTHIGNHAFSYCENITSITALGATSSGTSILRYCTSLTDVDMPLLATLGYYNFADCTALEEIELPSAVTYASHTFRTSTNLKKVSLATNDDAKFVSFGTNMFTDVDTSNIDLTVGTLNSSYVTGNTLTVSGYSFTFKSVTVIGVEEEESGSDAYNAWLGTWNLTSTSLSVTGTPLTVQITISQNIADSSYSIYGFDLSVLRNLYAMPAAFDSETGGWSVLGSNEVGTYGVTSSYTMMYCGYAYLGDPYNSNYILTGTYAALSATIDTDGTTGAIAVGTGTTSGGAEFTILTSRLYGLMNSTYYNFYNDTDNIAVTDLEYMIGPFTLSKVSSSSTPPATPAIQTTGVNMMGDMIFKAMNSKVE